MLMPKPTEQIHPKAQTIAAFYENDYLAAKDQAKISMLQMSMKHNVTAKLEKAFPDYAIVLHRYSKSNIFGSPTYKVPKIPNRRISKPAIKTENQGIKVGR